MLTHKELGGIFGHGKPSLRLVQRMSIALTKNHTTASHKSLPIDALLPQVVDILRDHRCLVLQAPPGAGKTTRIPPALQGSGLFEGKTIVLLEPRRLAARAAASRMAYERGETVGQSVGYWVRWDRKLSAQTKIWVLTEGMFLHVLQQDPFLEQIGAVIFDEFHERNLPTDLGLAMARKVQQEANPDLRLLIMSATISPKDLATYLEDCPTLVSEGQSAPVAIEHLEAADSRSIPEQAATGIRQVFAQSDGDILVFLPGMGEIQRTTQLLQDWACRHTVAIFPLHGSMPLEEQDRVLAPCDKTKIILSTNVAETSLTIEGIRTVVDTGYARILRYDANTGLNRLELERISQASSIQRAGRAGRTEPGLCLRLWTKHQQHKLSLDTEPEIHRVDLSGAILELLHWGEYDIPNFPWFEAPPQTAVEQGMRLLQGLGAIDTSGRMTPLGHRMAQIPLHPRLSRMMLAAQTLGCLTESALLAAMLSERDPFSPPEPGHSKIPVEESLDILDRLETLQAWASQAPPTPLTYRLKTSSVASVFRLQKQLLQLFLDTEPTQFAAPGSYESKSSSSTDTHAKSNEIEDRLRRCLLVAYPDRVARRRTSTPQSTQGLLVGGKGVQLARSQVPLNSDWFLCIDISTGGQGQSADWWVRLATPIQESWLPVEPFREQVEVFFDAEKQRVSSWTRKRWHDLVVSEKISESQDNDAIAQCLAEAASTRLEQALPLQDPQVRRFLARIRSLSRWMPEHNIPCFSEEEIRAMLPMLCAGKRSFAELQSLPLVAIWQDSLPYKTRQLLEQEAPERIEVPSGSQIRLEYQEDGPPILAVKIQEMFGLTETPRIAGGKISVLLHLLAPSMRPQQVTQDLANFWKHTYREVRKELRQRYPKHAWPEDPATAIPERRPQRRPQN